MAMNTPYLSEEDLVVSDSTGNLGTRACLASKADELGTWQGTASTEELDPLSMATESEVVAITAKSAVATNALLDGAVTGLVWIRAAKATFKSRTERCQVSRVTTDETRLGTVGGSMSMASALYTGDFFGCWAL